MNKHITRRVSWVCAVAILLVTMTACGAKRAGGNQPSAPISPVPASSPIAVTWPADPFAPGELENEALKRVWERFERSQPYRLAMPADRNLSPAARARVNSNSSNQIIPFTLRWGVRGLQKTGDTDVFVAIVVDPARSDAKRYGLVVIAAPESKGVDYRVYWALRDEDLESYLLSPASGSIFIEEYRRDGTDEIKELAWDRRSKRFLLK